MSPRILTLGSFTYDLFVRPQDATVMRFCRETVCTQEYMALPYGSKIALEGVYERFGGGAHNTAVSLSRLGFQVAPVGAIARDVRGEQIEQHLKKEGLSDQYIQKIADEKTGFSLVVNSFEGERTVLHYSGASRCFSDFSEEVLEKYDGLFCNHISAMESASADIFKTIQQHFLRFPHKFLAWNPGKEQLAQGIEMFSDFLPVVDIILMNREEAELFTGITAKKSMHEEQHIQKGVHFIPKQQDIFPHYAADYQQIFEKFFEHNAQKIGITDGRKGAQLCDGTNIYFCAIDESAQRIDTLGAGDAFGSTLFASIMWKNKLPFALKCATINAASVVSHIGAQTGLMRKKELFEREKKVEVVQAMKKL